MELLSIAFRWANCLRLHIQRGTISTDSGKKSCVNVSKLSSYSATGDWQRRGVISECLGCKMWYFLTHFFKLWITVEVIWLKLVISMIRGPKNRQFTTAVDRKDTWTYSLCFQIRPVTLVVINCFYFCVIARHLAIITRLILTSIITLGRRSKTKWRKKMWHNVNRWRRRL